MTDCKYALEIMEQELKSEFVCPEVRYAFKASIEALNKQIPKKPIENFYDENCGEDYYDEGYIYTCPTCQVDCEVGKYSKITEDVLRQQDYCQECGQKINWD